MERRGDEMSGRVKIGSRPGGYGVEKFGMAPWGGGRIVRPGRWVRVEKGELVMRGGGVVVVFERVEESCTPRYVRACYSNNLKWTLAGSGKYSVYDLVKVKVVHERDVARRLARKLEARLSKSHIKPSSPELDSDL